MKARYTQNLIGNGLVATDGDIGRCKDLLFDERSWVIRYLVVDTHKWLPFGRKLVISPISIDVGRSTESELFVNLTREQIKQSPPLAQHEPVSREYEKAFFQYYGYANYWSGPELWGGYSYPDALANVEPESLLELEHVAEENHLRSVQELEHYRVKCNAQTVGHIVDFVRDQQCWSIEAVVVDTQNWPGGSGKRLLPARDVTAIDWAGRSIDTKLSPEQVKSLPRTEQELEAEIDATKQN